MKILLLVNLLEQNDVSVPDVVKWRFKKTFVGHTNISKFPDYVRNCNNKSGYLDKQRKCKK